MPTQNNQNNPDNQKYKESESAILNLEILSTTYNNLLIKYKQSVADYINFLSHSKISDKTLTSLSGQAFWGTGQADSQSAYTDITDVNKCAALCLKTPNCTGATFNPTANGQPYCALRTGDGIPVPALPTDYAILPQAKILLINIQTLNTQLTNVNNQILDKIKNSNTLYSEQSVERSEKATALLENYKKLNNERVKIEKMVNEYQHLDQAQTEGNIKINANYYSFLLLFALSICVIIILYKLSGTSQPSQSSGYFQQGGELGINPYYILFGIILLAIFIYYYWFIYMYTTGVLTAISTFLYDNLHI